MGASNSHIDSVLYCGQNAKNSKKSKNIKQSI